MRMILGLNLASSQPLFRAGAGNLPETCGADGIREGFPLIRYQYDARRAGEPVSTERKHIPTIHTCLLLPLTGDCLNQNARKGYVAETENLARQRSIHSSLRTLNRQGKP